MKLLRLALGLFIGCILLTSCALKKDLFVLMPDADGKVGAITVTNKAGTQTLSNLRQATEIKDPDRAPMKPFVMEESEIKRTFGDALAAQKEFPVWLLFFELRSTALTHESHETLKEIIATINNKKSTDISLIGHTDRVGARQRNYALSVARALKIRDILVSHGIDPQYIGVNGLGEDMPLVKTEDGVSEPRNRRVEVKVR
jgi:outer membrane protein OmpA-like peptidoglycan-associated protein